MRDLVVALVLILGMVRRFGPDEDAKAQENVHSSVLNPKGMTGLNIHGSHKLEVTLPLNMICFSIGSQ